MKYFKQISFLTLILILGIKVYAACNCSDGWYECGGDMCCYGRGCPSAACGTGACLNWGWEPGYTEYIETTETYISTCYREETYRGTCTGTCTRCVEKEWCYYRIGCYPYTSCSDYSCSYPCTHTETHRYPCTKNRTVTEEIWHEGKSVCLERAASCENSGCYRCPEPTPINPNPSPPAPPKSDCSLTVHAWERPMNSTSCSATSTNRSGIPVQVCTAGGSCPEAWKGTTDGNGNFVINSIEATPDTKNLVVNFGLYEQGGLLYGVVCPEQKSSYDIEFIPEGNLVCFDKTVTVGTQQLPTDPWFTSLSGDIYANNISTDPFDTATIFKPNLISEYNGLPGYAISKNLITVEDDKTSENAGFVFNLDTADPYFNHNDIGLSRYRFSPPKHDEVMEWPSGNDFSGNSVYQISVADFNDKLSSDITYSIGNNTALLYVTGTNTLDIQNSITTSDSGRLIIVVEGSVNIRKEVGYSDTTGYGQDSNPNIMAGIISQGGISFETEGTQIGSDIPIMVQSPFVSLANINLERNLGIDNMDFPAVAAKYYSDYLYNLTKLERDSEAINYTGIQTFDVQFVYQD